VIYHKNRCDFSPNILWKITFFIPVIFRIVFIVCLLTSTGF